MKSLYTQTISVLVLIVADSVLSAAEPTSNQTNNHLATLSLPRGVLQSGSNQPPGQFKVGYDLPSIRGRLLQTNYGIPIRDFEATPRSQGRGAAESMNARAMKHYQGQWERNAKAPVSSPTLYPSKIEQIQQGAK